MFQRNGKQSSAYKSRDWSVKKSVFVGNESERL